MAATDQTYRNQYRLDLVFGISCVLMLIGTVWMFAQDYFREFKQVQREFRDVEEGVAQQTLVSLAPTSYEMKAIEDAQAAVARNREILAQVKAKLAGRYNELLALKVKSEDKQRFIKADLDSINSFFNIAIDKRNAEAPDSAAWKAIDSEVQSYQKQIDILKAKFDQAAAEVAENYKKLDDLFGADPLKVDEKAVVEVTLKDKDKTTVKTTQKAAENALADSEKQLKALTVDFDRFHKLAAEKRWGFGDWFRSLPVLDAFASPLRIQQYTLNDLPINYSFKYVTRYDRCTTCHLGIERESFTRENLKALGEAPSDELKERLASAKSILKARHAINPEISADIALNPVKLTPSQISMFSAHPRLDLFVSPNSPHRAEKFGCTICHSGQGSATDFFNVSHSPNSSPQQQQWQKEHGWESIHFWDYTMLPKRFIESSCIKCHHQLTGLVTQGSRIEAPKVFEGYTIIKEMGCFGCHEISGQKAGKAVGPDLRLEPDPPLDDLPAAERARILADTANPPGTLRKVGPNLRRIAEKTSEEWVRQWLTAPRDFRPTTKMPHFYGVTNNDTEALKGTGQEHFPAAEIHAVTHLLFERSKGYLGNVEERSKDPDEVREKARQRFEELSIKPKLTEEEKKEHRQLEVKLGRWKTERPVANLQLPADPADAKAKEEQLSRGRLLFSERGCLACHSHNATKTAGNGLPPIPSDNEFGPDLTRIADKLGKPDDPLSARRWLVQWIMDPTVHHPRTFMPITHLTKEQANDIAAWLLSQKSDWKGPAVPEPELHVFKKMARDYLQKAVPLKRELDEMLPESEDKKGVLKGFSKEQLAAMKPEADEQELSEPLDLGKLKMYIGRKAINQLGCYGCHYIPGYKDAKPIGTPLNDWGVKRADRLAFEDAAAYVAKNYHIVPERILEKDMPKHLQGKQAPWAVQDGKLPYEQFFFDLLEHHQREGFLHQKLKEPRSYDWSRLRSWEERLRMPQFRFSRKVPGPNATPEEIAAIELEEAEAREAVMTFVLGLVAEDIPKSFQYNPPPDKLAEIKGRSVLDKFNCAGCHLVRPAVYDLRTNPRITWLSEDQLNARPEALQTQRLEISFNNSQRPDQRDSDHPFPSHVAWRGHPPRQPGRVTVFGTNPRVLQDDEKKIYLVWPTQAVQFPISIWKDGREQMVERHVPASVPIQVVPGSLVPQPDGKPYASAFGGTYINMLVPFLQKLNPGQFPADPTGEDNARAVAPPSLIYEGEKTQPEWLFRFLKNPHEIRPITVLRMPKFNMSDEDIQSLVSYFSAVDRVNNPGIGLEYPYMPIPQREEAYLLRKNADYVRRLKEGKIGDKSAFELRLAELQPIWERLSREDLEATERRLKNAEKAVEEAKEADKKFAVEARDKLKQQIDEMKAAIDKKDFSRYRQRWEQQDAYLVDAFRLTANGDICLGCHQVGTIPGKQKLGPPLQLSWERLRPDWTEAWIANPIRFMYYKTGMPQNFTANATNYPQLFLGLPLEQIAAAEKKLEPLAGPYNAAKSRYEAADRALFAATKAAQEDPSNASAQADLATADAAFKAAQTAFNAVRQPFETVDQQLKDLKRLYSRNQLTAVRDSLIDFLRVVEIPENRSGPVPATPAPMPDKK